MYRFEYVLAKLKKKNIQICQTSEVLLRPTKSLLSFCSWIIMLPGRSGIMINRCIPQMLSRKTWQICCLVESKEKENSILLKELF